MYRKRFFQTILSVALLLVAVLVIAPTVSAAGKGNKWIALRYNFKPGQHLEYGTTMTMSGTTSVTVGGTQASPPMSMRMRTGFTMDTVSVDQQGTGTVKLTFDDFNTDIEVQGQTMNMRMGASGIKMYTGGQLIYDSSQSTGSPMEQMLGGAMPDAGQLSMLFSKGMTVTITRCGRTKTPEPAPMVTGGLMGINLVEQTPLPERLVRPGDAWSSAPMIPGLGEKIPVPGIALENVFEGIEDFRGRQCARIVTRANIDLSGLPSDQTQPPGIKFSSLRLTGDGVAYLDLDEGVLLKQDGEFLLEMVGGGLIEFPSLPGATPGGAAPPTADMKMSMRMKVTTELKK